MNPKIKAAALPALIALVVTSWGYIAYDKWQSSRKPHWSRDIAAKYDNGLGGYFLFNLTCANAPSTIYAQATFNMDMYTGKMKLVKYQTQPDAFACPSAAPAALPNITQPPAQAIPPPPPVKK